MRSAIFIVMLALCAGCRPTDVEPPEVSSFSYRTDGTRHIMPVAAPKVSAKLTANTTAGFSTTPLPLPYDKGLVIGTRDGGIIIFTKNDSINTAYVLKDTDPVYRLAANSETILALHLSGSITGVSHDGKIKWQSTDSVSRADIILSGNTLLRIASGSIAAFDAASGTKKFTIQTQLIPVAAAAVENVFYVALNSNAPQGADSVYKITHTGTIEGRWGFAGMRITSNIAISGDEHNYLSFGAQGEPDASGVRRRTYVLASEIEDNDLKQLLRQELEYIPTNVSVIGDVILASGFQMGGEDYAGAVDAFSVNSGDKLWQRRFTEPLASPVAVTTQHAFFTLTFESQASIGSKALFYALELPTGQTVREFGITDALHGFVPGLPMPYKGGLLLADRNNTTIYKLTVE